MQEQINEWKSEGCPVNKALSMIEFARSWEGMADGARVNALAAIYEGATEECCVVERILRVLNSFMTPNVLPAAFLFGVAKQWLKLGIEDTQFLLPITLAKYIRGPGVISSATDKEICDFIAFVQKNNSSGLEQYSALSPFFLACIDAYCATYVGEGEDDIDPFVSLGLGRVLSCCCYAAATEPLDGDFPQHVGARCSERRDGLMFFVAALCDHVYQAQSLCDMYGALLLVCWLLWKEDSQFRGADQDNPLVIVIMALDACVMAIQETVESSSLLALVTKIALNCALLLHKDEKSNISAAGALLERIAERAAANYDVTKNVEEDQLWVKTLAQLVQLLPESWEPKIRVLHYCPQEFQKSYLSHMVNMLDPDLNPKWLIDLKRFFNCARFSSNEFRRAFCVEWETLILKCTYSEEELVLGLNETLLFYECIPNFRVIHPSVAFASASLLFRCLEHVVDDENDALNERLISVVMKIVTESEISSLAKCSLVTERIPLIFDVHSKRAAPATPELILSSLIELFSVDSIDIQRGLLSLFAKLHLSPNGCLTFEQANRSNIASPSKKREAGLVPMYLSLTPPTCFHVGDLLHKIWEKWKPSEEYASGTMLLLRNLMSQPIFGKMAFGPDTVALVELLKTQFIGKNSSHPDQLLLFLEVFEVVVPYCEEEDLSARLTLFAIVEELASLLQSFPTCVVGRIFRTFGLFLQNFGFVTDVVHDFLFRIVPLAANSARDEHSLPALFHLFYAVAKCIQRNNTDSHIRREAEFSRLIQMIVGIAAEHFSSESPSLHVIMAQTVIAAWIVTGTISHRHNILHRYLKPRVDQHDKSESGEAQKTERLKHIESLQAALTDFCWRLTFANSTDYFPKLPDSVISVFSGCVTRTWKVGPRLVTVTRGRSLSEALITCRAPTGVLCFTISLLNKVTREREETSEVKSPADVHLELPTPKNNASCISLDSETRSPSLQSKSLPNAAIHLSAVLSRAQSSNALRRMEPEEESLASIKPPSTREPTPIVPREEKRVGAETEFDDAIAGVFFNIFAGTELLPFNVLNTCMSHTEPFLRSLSFLDHIPCTETTKVGVLFLPQAEAADPEWISESSLLSSVTPSEMFWQTFLQIGSLKSLRSPEVTISGIKEGWWPVPAPFTGGIPFAANDEELKNHSYGTHYVAHLDPFQKIAFHIAALMPNPPKDPACNKKKRIIGNDPMVIIYCGGPLMFSYDRLISAFHTEVVEVFVVVEEMTSTMGKVTVLFKDRERQSTAPFIANFRALPHLLLSHLTWMSSEIKARHFDQGSAALNWVERVEAISELWKKHTNSSNRKQQT